MKLRDLFAKKKLLFLSAALFAFQLNANADEDAPPAVQIHGYGTMGYSRVLQELKSDTLSTNTTAGRYGLINKSGTSLYNSILGLNLSYIFNDKVTFYGQLTGQGSNFFQGGVEGFQVKVDMAMLNYHPFDWVDVRVGRQIMPIWMVSEQIDVGVTYPWIRPPMEVYNLAPVKTANGIGADFKHALGDILDASGGFRYGDGTYSDPNFENQVLLSRIFVGYTEFNFQNILKIRGSYGNTTAYAKTLSSTLITKDQPTFLTDPEHKPATTTGKVNFTTEFNFYSLGGTFDWQNFLVMGEYAAMRQTIQNPTPDSTSDRYLGPGGGSFSFKAWYGTLAYRFGDFTPHFTYSQAERSAYNINTNHIADATFTNNGSAFSTIPAGVVPSLPNGLSPQMVSNAIASGVKSMLDKNVAQRTYTFGLNYNFAPTIVGKAQFEQIRTNDAPIINFLNSPTLPSNDIMNIGEVALSFVF